MALPSELRRRAATLVVLVLVINLLGDWLRDVMNPRLYKG